MARMKLQMKRLKTKRFKKVMAMKIMMKPKMKPRILTKWMKYLMI